MKWPALPVPGLKFQGPRQLEVMAFSWLQVVGCVVGKRGHSRFRLQPPEAEQVATGSSHARGEKSRLMVSPAIDVPRHCLLIAEGGQSCNSSLLAFTDVR